MELPIVYKEKFTLAQPYGFVLDGNIVEIPKDFNWNGASIPRLFQPLFGGRYAKKNLVPSLVHDYLISIDWNVKERDLRFYTALIDTGRNRKVAFIMYLGVRLYSKVVYER